MSLLMEALRKAEEAKRMAAQKQEDTEGEVKTGASSSSTAEAPESIEEAVTEPSNEADVNAATTDEDETESQNIDWDSEVEGSTPNSSIDNESIIEFDAPAPVHRSQVTSLDTEVLDDEPTAKENEDVPEPVEADESERDFKFAEPEPPLERSTNIDPVPEEPIEAIVQADLKASHAPKPKTERFNNEARNRENARAVFNAKKSGDRGNKRSKIIAVVAVLVLIPIVGVAYLVVKSMFAPVAQYNIPPAVSVNERDAQVSTIPLQEPAPSVANSLIDAAGTAVNNPIAQVSALASTDSQAESSVGETIAESVSAVATREPTAIEPISATNASANIAAAAPKELTPVVPPTTDEPVLVSSVAANTTESNAPVESATVSSVDDLNKSAAPSANVDEPRPAINITRRDTREAVDQRLVEAYAAFRNGDYLGARARYQQVVRDKPNNRDAILGLGAVATQLNDVAAAREHYGKLLQLDPRDVHARMGILETMPSSDPVLLESELKRLFAAHPNVAQLAFALGNHYASQGRWSDAQQSYYDALLAEKAGGDGPISPDYAFNLAVSLERLNQLRPAQSFYGEALQQSNLVAPNFDIQVLQERLAAIARVLQ